MDMLETLHRRKGICVCFSLLLLTAAVLHTLVMLSFHVRELIKAEVRRAGQEMSHMYMTNRDTDGSLFQLKKLTFNRSNVSKVNGSTPVRPIKPVPTTRSISSTLLPSVCADEGCRSAYVGHFQVEDEYPIPAIRHIIWKSETVSMYFAEQLRSWQGIHPDWTYVLWRDQDLEHFVVTYFPGLLEKFRSLPEQIMRVDMIRYMIMFKYGGVYADLDYRLVKSLDTHRRFHAVITREPDSHSLQFRGLSWPVKPFANPAFLMSAPGHVFYFYAVQLLNARNMGGNVLNFAGPIGLTEILESYTNLFPITANPMAAVYVPPSYSFYPYKDNRLSTSNSDAIQGRFDGLRHRCKTMMSSDEPIMQQLRVVSKLSRYCTDVNNMDPITDKTQPVIAIHDLQKAGGIWYGSAGNSFYTKNVTDIRTVLKKVTFGSDFMRT